MDAEKKAIVTWALVGALIGALVVGGMTYLWHLAGEIDANPNRPAIKNQLMRKKSDAMYDLLDALVYGKLNRVDARARTISETSAFIESWLNDELYEQHGSEFEAALRDVRAAAQNSNAAAAREAALRLERSCLECHAHLNARAPQASK